MVCSGVNPFLAMYFPLLRDYNWYRFRESGHFATISEIATIANWSADGYSVSSTNLSQVYELYILLMSKIINPSTIIPPIIPAISIH